MSELPSYQIVKYSDEQIIMKSLITKQLYTYVNYTVPQFQPIYHENIQTPTVFENGLLYPLPLTNLAKQIDLINRNQHSLYEQAELVNTFIPLVEVLKEIHQKENIHGALSPEAIIFDNQGNIKLLYPSPKQFSVKYYSQTNIRKKSQDFQALGKILLQFVQQSNNKKLQNSYRSKIQLISKSNRYSASFLCALLIMLQKVQIHFQQLISLLSNKDYIREQKNIELRRLYQSILRQSEINHKTQPQLNRNKRVIIKQQFTPPLIKHSQSIISPKNKNQAIISKKLVRAQQNAQNKKTFEQIKRKEQKGDTVLKNMRNAKLVVEGENYDNLYKKILRDIRQTKERQDIVKITTKRRTISKKKLNS